MTKKQKEALEALRAALVDGEKLAVELNQSKNASVHAAPLLGRVRSTQESVEWLSKEPVVEPEAPAPVAAVDAPAITTTAAKK